MFAYLILVLSKTAFFGSENNKSCMASVTCVYRAVSGKASGSGCTECPMLTALPIVLSIADSGVCLMLPSRRRIIYSGVERRGPLGEHMTPFP